MIDFWRQCDWMERGTLVVLVMAALAAFGLLCLFLMLFWVHR